MEQQYWPHQQSSGHQHYPGNRDTVLHRQESMTRVAMYTSSTSLSQPSMPSLRRTDRFSFEDQPTATTQTPAHDATQYFTGLPAGDHSQYHYAAVPDAGYTHQRLSAYGASPTAATHSLQHTEPISYSFPSYDQAIEPSTRPRASQEPFSTHYSQVSPPRRHTHPPLLLRGTSRVSRSHAASTTSGLVKQHPYERRPEPPRSPSRAPFHAPTTPSVGGPTRMPRMHRCEQCGHEFPRPSGLRTHMNSHNGVKPWGCSYPGCCKAFGVRSNAKRHMRTHGSEFTRKHPEVIPLSPSAKSVLENAEITVSPSAHPNAHCSPRTFPSTPTSAPLVSQNSFMTSAHSRWIPPSLRNCSNISNVRVALEWTSSPECETMSTPDGSDLSMPLSPVVPDGRKGEERDSYAPMPEYPYHPTNFRVLPGPRPVNPQHGVFNS